MDATSFHSLDSLAASLGLPRAWLRREADAGRIPFLAIGRRRRFDLAAVRRALAGRVVGEQPSVMVGGRVQRVGKAVAV